ncbi:MAG: S-layer homology domain-containing protein [Ruminococcaceae bacterium]|nr:S-layer homology domain-containing protein [Oscillospiraceae bacterium]
MKIKYISILFCFLMLLSTVVCAEDGRAKIKSDESEMAAKVMNILEIIEEAPDKNGDVINRVDFAVYLCRLLGVSEYGESSYTYYTDVPEDHYALACVNYLTEIGAMAGEGDNKFRPDEPISPIEAAKVIFDSLGYRWYAQCEGGYPSAYAKFAAETKLFDGFTKTGNITREELTVILLRAGFIRKYSDIKGEQEEKTVFSSVWDIYDQKGIVESANGVSIVDSAFRKMGTTQIGDVVYDNGQIDTDKFLGRYVRAVTRENDSVNELIWITMSDLDNNEIIIDANDFEKFTGNAVYYCKGKSIRHENISKNASVIYNGRLAEYSIADIFNITKGTIELITPKGSSEVATVIINNYESFIVSYVDANAGIVYGKDQSGVILNEKDFSDNIIYVNSDGSSAAFSDIKSDMVVSIARNGNFCAKVLLSGKTETGAIGKVYDDDGQFAVVNDNPYRFDKVFTKNDRWFENSAFKWEGTVTYKLYIDAFDEIVYISSSSEEVDNNTVLIGYIVKYVEVKEDEDYVTMRIFTSDEVFENLKCSDRIRIDGVTCKTTGAVIDALNKGDGEVIRYRVNENNEIINIDTSFFGNETDDSLAIAAEKMQRMSKQANSSLNNDIVLKSTAIVFHVPDENKEYAPENYFSVSKGFGWGEDAHVLSKSYKFSKKSVAQDVCVVYEESGGNVTFRFPTMSVITGVSVGINENDEVVYFIEGLDYSKGKGKWALSELCNSEWASKFVNVASNEVIASPADLSDGDIVSLAFNSRNEIVGVKLLFDYSTGIDTPPKWWSESNPIYKINSYDTMSSNDVLTRAYCLRKENGVLCMVNSIDSENAAFLTQTNTPYNISKVLVVDTTGRKISAYEGTVNDVPEIDVMGSSTNPVFVYTFKFAAREIVVFK